MTENRFEAKRRRTLILDSSTKDRLAIVPFSDINSPDKQTLPTEPEKTVSTTHRHLHQPIQITDKYNVCQVLDRGVFPEEWTSHRLLTETIYFADSSHQYELKRYPVTDSHYRRKGNYCLSLVQPEDPAASSVNDASVPLSPQRVVPLHDHISWYDVCWGIRRVTIKDLVIEPRFLTFLPNSSS